MNFPNSQLVGEASELVVRQLFTGWRWVVGKDFIDVGYDFVITPDQSVFRGARFCVQVKGTTTRGKRSYIANVSKERLRQYAESVVPVFILRVLPDGRILWLDARKWCRDHPGRLAGSGETGLKFPDSNVLSDEREFTEYLKPSMLPMGQRRDAVAVAANERAAYLSSIDDRLRVRIDYVNGRESYAVSAAKPNEEFAAGLVIKPVQQPANFEKLRDAMNYGVPAEFDAAEFRMTGSPLFEEIGAGRGLAGRISLRPTRSESVQVTMVPGDKFSLTAPSVRIDSKLYRGARGLAVLSESEQSPLSLRAQFDPNESGTKANITLSTNTSGYLSSAPIANLTALAGFSEWFEQATTKRSIWLCFDFEAGRVPAVLGEAEASKILSVFGHLAYLSKLHAIAKFCASGFQLPPLYELSDQELDEIDTLYKILRGERVEIGLQSLQFDPQREFDGSRGELIATTELVFVILGNEVGKFPVAIQLKDFDLLPGTEKFSWRLQRVEGAQSLLYYDEHSSA